MRKLIIIAIYLIALLSCSYTQKKDKIEPSTESNQNIDSTTLITMPLSYKNFELGTSFIKCLEASKKDTSIYDIRIKNIILNKDSLEPKLPRITEYSAKTKLFNPPIETIIFIRAVDDTISSIQLDLLDELSDNKRYDFRYLDVAFNTLVSLYSEKYGNSFKKHLDDYKYVWYFKNGFINLSRYKTNEHYWEEGKRYPSHRYKNTITIHYIDNYQKEKLDIIDSLRTVYKNHLSEEQKDQEIQKTEKRFKESKKTVLNDI